MTVSSRVVRLPSIAEAPRILGSSVMVWSERSQNNNRKDYVSIRALPSIILSEEADLQLVQQRQMPSDTIITAVANWDVSHSSLAYNHSLIDYLIGCQHARVFMLTTYFRAYV